MESSQVKKAHVLYMECRKLLDSSEQTERELLHIEDETEKEFWVQVSDFFLQQKQKEVIRKGDF